MNRYVVQKNSFLKSNLSSPQLPIHQTLTILYPNLSSVRYLTFPEFVGHVYGRTSFWERIGSVVKVLWQPQLINPPSIQRSIEKSHHSGHISSYFLSKLTDYHGLSSIIIFFHEHWNLTTSTIYPKTSPLGMSTLGFWPPMFGAHSDWSLMSWGPGFNHTLLKIQETTKKNPGILDKKPTSLQTSNSWTIQQKLWRCLLVQKISKNGRFPRFHGSSAPPKGHDPSVTPIMHRLAPPVFFRYSLT